MVKDDEKGISKVRITRDMCKNFGWHEKEILYYALENTAKLFPYKVFPMCDFLLKGMGGMNIEGAGVSSGENDIICCCM